jgi:membrane protein YdbS with pleckstrin-like domain
MSNLYELQRGGVSLGEFSSAELRTMAKQGDLKPDDMVRSLGSSYKWIKAGGIKDLGLSTPQADDVQITSAPTKTHTPITEESVGAVMERSGEMVSELAEALSYNREELPARLTAFMQDSDPMQYCSRPSKLALILSLVVRLGLFAVVEVVILITILLEGTAGRLASAFILILIIMGFSAFFMYLGWKNTFYVITKTRTLMMIGIFNVKITIIMNKHVQIISINTGIVDSWLGLNTIDVYTAARASGIASVVRPEGCIRLKNVNASQVMQHYAIPADDSQH